METIIRGLIRSYHDDIVRHSQEMIRIRSSISAPQPGKPFGEGVAEALAYMLALASSLGFKTLDVDGYAGHAEFGDGDGIVAVLVHVDTVPEGAGWTHDPFGGEVCEGYLYGRGASDNKGPAVVSLFALKALKEAGVVPEKRIRIIFGTNEECGMSDMDYYFSKQPLPDYAFTPDGDYPIIHAEKGYYVVKLSQCTSAELSGGLRLEGGTAPNSVPDRCSVRMDRNSEASNECTFNGVTAHGATPGDGINAIALALDYLKDTGLIDAHAYPLADFLHARIGHDVNGEKLGIACTDTEHGSLTVNLGQFRMDEQMAEAWINIRYPVTFDGETIIGRLRLEAEAVGLTLEVATELPPLYIPAEHPLIRKLCEAYESVTGERATLLSIGGGTYARKLNNRGVAFGANFLGTDPRAHQADERMLIDDLMRHAEICAVAMYKLLEV